MEFEDFNPTKIFYTSLGKWIVIKVNQDSYNGDGYSTPVVFALPLQPNKKLESENFEPLMTEFYKWDFYKCFKEPLSNNQAIKKGE